MNAPSKPAKAAAAQNNADPSAAQPRPALDINAAIFKDVRVAIKVKLGEADVTVEELMALKSGAVLPLDRLINDLVDLHLNGSLIGRGEIVAVDDHFGIRIVEIGAAA